MDCLNGDNAQKDLEKLQELELIEIKSLSDDYASYDSAILVGENEDENMQKHLK